MSDTQRAISNNTYLVMYQDGKAIGVGKTMRGRAERLVTESNGRWRIVDEAEWLRAKKVMDRRLKDAD